MKRCALIALLVLLGLHATDVAAQIVVVKDELVNADSLRRAWDHGPNFGACHGHGVFKNIPEYLLCVEKI